MSIRAQRVTLVWAEVCRSGVEYRVWPSGAVEERVWYTDVEGHWRPCLDYEDWYDEVREAGLAAING